MEKEKFNPKNYWEDRLEKIGGLEGVGFKKLGPSFNKWAYRVRKNVFNREVQALVSDPGNLCVLDIGSGTGFYIKLWLDFKVKEVTGSDITKVCIANLKNTFPGSNFYLTDISDKNFNEQKNFTAYDLVSCMDVLFHVVDDNLFEQSVQNIASLIKPGGYFIYSDFFLKEGPIRGESQVSRNKDYLHLVFEKNGLEMIKRKPFMYFTNKPADSKNPLLKLYWFLLENTLYVAPFLGHVLGALLYPLETLAVRMASESPTTELAIYRKKG